MWVHMHVSKGGRGGHNLQGSLQKSGHPPRFFGDVPITSSVFIAVGWKVDIALDVLGFPVMGRSRVTFRVFYVADFRPRLISPAWTQFPSTKLAWTHVEHLIFSSHNTWTSVQHKAWTRIEARPGSLDRPIIVQGMQMYRYIESITILNL